ncbi:uridine nucleosidase [Marchantia polymorpha subsp. ruderalis]
MPQVSMPEESMVRAPKKIIIDTDPGIDDAMAILLAFESPELDIIGITTTFGNVRTTMASNNALHLCELGGRDDIPVSQGLETSLRGQLKNRIADFVHGQDGLGNTHPPAPKRSAIAQSAPDFFRQKSKEYPGEVTIVALGPLSNVAKAVEDDPDFAKNIGQIIVLGGNFMVNGNVNPAAEANIYGDPEAADIVFTCGADIIIIGINVTHQVFFTGKEMEEVRDSKGKYGKYLYDVSKFYFAYHQNAYDIDAIYLHDPTTMIAAIDPSLFTYAKGVVRVQRDGICKGLTVFNNTSKKWAEPTDWCNLPEVKVAMTVDAPAISKMMKDRLMGV